MKSKHRNIFFAFGIGAIAIMLVTFDMDYSSMWQSIRQAGWWFAAVLGVWLLIYLFNALSWYSIIRGGQGQNEKGVGFWRIYKLTITGFALNYATPVGLMGGEPYRIMELSPALGTARATSSVILYVMTHIFSHICFWASTVILYPLLYDLTTGVALLLVAAGLFCAVAIRLFIQGYSRGVAMTLFRLLSRLPIIKRWASPFMEKQRETLALIDSHITNLHSRGKRYMFSAALLYEFSARIMTSLETYLLLMMTPVNAGFIDSIMITSFTSLFANIFFFSPMQAGARDGGYALAMGGLAMSGAWGIYASLLSRVREIIWIIIGLLLMKVGNRADRR